MNGKPDVDLEDRLRTRLRELDRVAVAPYAALRERAGRRRSSAFAFALAATAVIVIVLGAIASNRFRESQLLSVGSSAAPTGDCGARTSQLDSMGHLVGVTKDSTTILVRPLSDVRSETETWFDWYMTGTALLAVYAQYEDGSRVAPSFNEPTGQDSFLVRLVLPKAGCWELHSERAGGKLSGDVWVQVLAPGTAAGGQKSAKPDCNATSRRDATGRLIGTTQDSTTILVGAPTEVRLGVEITLDWYMTFDAGSSLTVFAQYEDGSRVTPNLIETVDADDFRVHLAFPKSGCWRLHAQRVKVSGDVWLQVLPAR